MIGGRWRGRKLRFPQTPGLRPTPDRVRETLFNWLVRDLAGAKCLDLFAGSGALGIEALSRGAAEVILVERNARAAAMLKQQVQQLRAGPTLQVVHADAMSFLRRTPRAMNIVFIDPPYRSHLYEPVSGVLMDLGWLQPLAWIYVEVAHGEPWVPPPAWRLHRQQTAGDVQGSLYQYDVNSV